jgi:hypothetical protein
VKDRDSRLLDDPEVEILFGRYRYLWRGTRWRFQQIVSPLIQRYAIFSFEASEGLDDYSELTLIVSSVGREKYLVPIANHGMVGYPNVFDDPHNIAIFNSLISKEAIHPKVAVNWFQLSLLYLNLIGEREQIADWEDFSRRSHAGMLTLLPKLRNLEIVPRVACENKKCDVQIFELLPDQLRRIDWELEFDTQSSPPQLNTVSRELQALNEPVPQQ